MPRGSLLFASTLLGAAFAAPVAHADETSAPAVATATALATPAAARTQAVYVDLLGKGGLWGLGYDWQPSPRIALGATASAYVLGGDRYLTLSPYMAAYPVLHGHHRAFAQIGPQIVHRSTPSPGPEWSGMSVTAGGGELSAGYEYRDRLLVRGYVEVALGERLVPWAGGSIGWTF